LAADGEAKKHLRAGGNYPTDGDIHPLRLCEEIKNFMQREAILSVDGQEILNFSRQSIPTFVPGHRLNSEPFGTMGVGLPFAVGAKAAKPNAQVIWLHGDGSLYVEEPEDIRPALERARREIEEGMVGFVNVKTDHRARATTVRFSSRET
jgi:hypothetical protein